MISRAQVPAAAQRGGGGCVHVSGHPEDADSSESCGKRRLERHYHHSGGDGGVTELSCLISESLKQAVRSPGHMAHVHPLHWIHMGWEPQVTHLEAQPEP